MKKQLLLALLLSPILFASCETLENIQEALEDFGNVTFGAFIIAGVLGLMILLASHFDFDIMEEVSDFSPGCAITTFCIIFFGLIFMYMCS